LGVADEEVGHDDNEMTAEASGSVRSPSEVPEKGREVFQIARIERQTEPVSRGSDQTVHGADVMTEPQPKRLTDRPVKILRCHGDELEMLEKLDGSLLSPRIGRSVDDLQPDDRTQTKG